jgi:hypothetical protein
MKYVVGSIFGGVLFVGGLVLVWYGFGEHRDSLAIAGSIIIAAAYLGGPSADGRGPANQSA